MKTTRRGAAVLVAVGALGLGGAVVAVPAIAGAAPFGQPAVAASDAGQGWQGGSGMGPGYRTGAAGGPEAGRTTHGGSCLGVTAARGTLTEQQKTTLAAMAQEEKLAHDLYAAFAAKYPAVVFDRIAAAETQHLTAVRGLLDRYGLTDSTAGQPAGTFTDRTVQASYAKLLAEGRANEAAAVQVGQRVETSDVAALRAALSGLTAPDVQQVYTHLLTASQHHLSVFENWPIG